MYKISKNVVSRLKILIIQSCPRGITWEVQRGGPMVGVPVSGSSDPDSSPGQGRCVVFLGKAISSHSASLHPGV